MPTVSPTPDSVPVHVAAFDFDGTLTQGDSLLPFLWRSLGWLGFARALILSSPWLVAYALRLMSNYRAKARLLQVSLAGSHQTEIQRHADDFVTRYLPAQWNTWARQQLLDHQQQGHRCVIVSASPGIYLHAMAASIGIHDVLCTEMELVDETFTGLMATPNCHGEEKVIRLQSWLDATLGKHAKLVLYAYGDTSGDKPMLRLAQQAWYRGVPWSSP